MSLTIAGGVLGVFCSHAYPHASDNASILLPRGLKGADLVLFSVLHSLGVEVDVLPVMFAHGFRDMTRDYWDSEDYDDSEHDDDTGIDHNENSKNKGKNNNKGQEIDDVDSYAYLDPGLKTHIGKSLNPFVAADSYEDQPFVEVSISCQFHSGAQIQLSHSVPFSSCVFFSVFNFNLSSSCLNPQDPKLRLCDSS